MSFTFVLLGPVSQREHYDLEKSTNVEVFQKIGNIFLERLQNVESTFCFASDAQQ